MDWKEKKKNFGEKKKEYFFVRDNFTSMACCSQTDRLAVAV
jgi:hypothetical protein